ncbi:MAG: UDP-phosphate galactose phosphotransferase, partial [Elusimicrobia bacterium RIFCSPLOWO2_01_FULL_54_10]
VLFLKYARKNGLNRRNMLIAGTGPRAIQFINLIHQHQEWGFNIIGLVDTDPGKRGTFVRDCEILGTLEDIPEIIHGKVVDEVVFVVPRSWIGKLEDVMLFCENEGINVSVAVDFFRLRHSYVRQTDMDGFPLLSFKTTPDKILHLALKRSFDIVASGTALLFLAPLFLAVFAAIKMTSKGPAFFKQLRCGLHGRQFTLYKFRTMVIDAEAKKAALMGHNEMSGPTFKMEHDPRITPIGAFLRKFSIDEFPQFWNVFKGDMTLVGPRPPLPSEVNKYDCWHRRRLSMTPGVTCLWQVNGRNKITDFNEWVKLDLEYIDNWSLWLELKIILKTIPVVLFGVGAK